jgi:hypothetical protein
MGSPRFLFDEDLMGVGRLIQSARADRGDVWVIGYPPSEIKRGTDDKVWLPKAGALKLIVFRIDNDLLDPNSPSHRAWRGGGCRGFVVAIHQSKSSLWDQLHTIIRYWHRIETHCRDHERDKSWVAKITREGVTSV